VAESTVEILLSANRCLELLCSSHFVDRLFGGRRTWVWLSLPLAYGLYISGFQSPTSFNGILFTWLLYPHYGYLDQQTHFGDTVL
jgi:hypothetical protein